MAELFERKYRDNFRKVILNHLTSQFNDEEVYAFHPMIDDLLISNRGNIKNAETDKPRKFQLNSNGYLGVNVKFSHKGRRFVFVHRLIAETFYGFTGIDNYYYEVNHIDGNKLNNDLTNLEWLTRQENLEHSRLNRLSKSFYGESNGNSKLTKQDLCDIVSFKDLGFSISDISKSFNINRNYCSKLIKTRTN